MRRWPWPLLLFVSMFFAGGCSSDFNPLDYVEVKLPPLSEEHKALFYTEPWNTWETFKNQKGIVVKKEFGDGTAELRIQTICSDPGKNYFLGCPLNMPEEYWIEGIEIVFSGETREHPLIDLYPLPLILTNLGIKKEWSNKIKE